MKNQIGIIGHGRFGAYFATQLRNAGYSVCAFDIAGGDGVLPLGELKKCPMVIYAVPIRALRIAINETIAFLSPSAIVLDVCSVKMIPCGILNELLPGFRRCGLHPLFGPQSAPNSCVGQRMAVCWLESPYPEVQEMLGALGVKVIECTPEEHDRQMAESQFLTHFIGRAAEACGIQKVPLSTKTHDDLMDIVEIITGNSVDLFHDMAVHNPMVAPARAKFLAAMIQVDAQIAAKEAAVKDHCTS